MKHLVTITGLYLSILTGLAQNSFEPETMEHPLHGYLVNVIGLRSDLKLTEGTGFIAQAGDKPVVLTSKSLTKGCIALFIANGTDIAIIPTWGENEGCDATMIPVPESKQKRTGLEIKIPEVDPDDLNPTSPITITALRRDGTYKTCKGELERPQNKTATFEENLPLECSGSPVQDPDGKIIGICSVKIWDTERVIVPSATIKEYNNWIRIDTAISPEEIEYLKERFRRERTHQIPILEQIDIALNPVRKPREGKPPWILQTEGKRLQLIEAQNKLDKTQQAIDWTLVGNPQKNTMEVSLKTLIEFQKAAAALTLLSQNYEKTMWGSLQMSYPADKASDAMRIVEKKTKPLEWLGSCGTELAEKSTEFLTKWATGKAKKTDSQILKAAANKYGKAKQEAADAWETER